MVRKESVVRHPIENMSENFLVIPDHLVSCAMTFYLKSYPQRVFRQLGSALLHLTTLNGAVTPTKVQELPILCLIGPRLKSTMI